MWLSIIVRDFYIPSSAGFLPSTVSMLFLWGDGVGKGVTVFVPRKVCGKS